MQSQDLSPNDSSRYILQVYVGALSLHYEALSVEASKQTTADEIVSCIVERLGLPGDSYELAEVAGECKERRLAPEERPVSVMLLWPMHLERDFHRFYLRESQQEFPWLLESYGLDPNILRDFIPFLLQPENREYPDLCQLPDLNESTLLENLRQRFENGHIYTYVGSILIALNPFKFHPIYNPKYVRLYQNHRVGPVLPPHIFAIADNAYYCMLKDKRNQCVVISGESGSGKTESTNFLLHHLTALSQKGSHGSGVEQTILSAGPVLEAFGNAKTAHNNNSSRFGKFIQVNYRENGMVQGAVVQKYLLEKSRIVSQGPYERNYHVFYYLLSGTTESEREALHLLTPDKYCYLNTKNLTLENCDEKYEFSRLKQSMEMVGFSPEKQRRLFNVLSAVLLLGNVEFYPKKSTYHHDESVQVRNPDVVSIISELLKVKQDTLLAALTSKRVKASGETLIMQYKLPEAIAARDALAKCLYGALFDWIVLQVNHALLNKDQTPHTGHSIGVLDIFGFEDFGSQNSFEQLCINYANEHLQCYFNLHVFKFEQNEYKREGIKWRDIEFMDNSGCLQLFESKPSGLLCILDDLCSFPGATNETLLQKFNSVHKENTFYEKPARKENAFIIHHYAGKVKYQVTEMREKNLDLMRQDIVSVLKNSSMAFVRELVGADPVAVFRWAILRAFFRGYFAFRMAGVKHRKERADQVYNKLPGKNRFRTPNELLVSKRQSYADTKTSSSSSSSSSSTNLPSPQGNTTTTTLTSPTSFYSHYNNQSPSSSSSAHQRNYTTNKNSLTTGSTTASNYNNSNSNGSRRMWSTAPSFNNLDKPNSPSSDYYDKLSKYNSNVSSRSGAGGVGPIGSSTRNNAIGTSSKFERTNQDVMARASQIVQKNKSFRPRERSKKGLKNLQSVKTLTGQNNFTNNPSSGVKTRKQPLTVAAQFQNSLIALMETLNQANPFFIRCIKSNPHKIPNKFDEQTVTRQLRYTGMLETVRIRRAGYNVRLTYEEFIQLYRILLPKGLISSQKDVRDFMNTMDLNKQYYQLGVTKIYMRESEKRKLDVNLHQKIINSIILIQRWFRSILQRKRFILLRHSAITIQSYWRMYLSQKSETNYDVHTQAATTIQATWRMYVVRRWYLKLKAGVICVQAAIRGARARIEYAERRSRQRIKQIKERTKLRPTQSLPASDDQPGNLFYEADRSLHATRQHYSTDSPDQIMRNLNYDLCDEKQRDIVSIAQGQFRSLMITKGDRRDDKQQQQQPVEEEVVDRPTKVYDLDRAAKNYFKEDTTESTISYLPQKQQSPAHHSVPSGMHSTVKTQARRVDSGPSPIRRDHQRNHQLPHQDVEIVFINDLECSPKMPRHLDRERSKVLQRRDIICRSTGDENFMTTPSHPSSTSSSNYSLNSQATTPNQPSVMTSVDKTNIFMSVPNKDKAAAILGPIPELNQRSSNSEAFIRSRRVKTNLSDEFSSHPNPTSAAAIVHPVSGSGNGGGGGGGRRGIASAIPSGGGGGDTLRRRNSDPTNKIPLLEVNRGNDMYQSSTHINIAGHRFRKAPRIGKTEKCASCQESDAFVNEGYRCLDCKLLVHTKCIQNGGVKTLHCEAKRSKRLRASKNQEKLIEKNNAPNSKYSGTREYIDSTDKIISDAKELQNMQAFITKKIMEMEATCDNPSEVDRVFRQALREFKDNLVAQYSVANKQNSDVLNIKYRDLISNFNQVMETCSGRKDDFPLTMGVNAFRGFMNEFMSSRETEKPKAKRKKEKRRKIEDHTNYNGHTFQLTIINIATACEICTQFLLWPIERGLVCQNCRLTCHKKCYQKSTHCKNSNSNNSGGGGGAGGIASSQNNCAFDSKLFGVSLTNLCLMENSKIPIQIDQLITKIEMLGLYAEGIYRKSGVSSKIKELKMRMSDVTVAAEIDYETYNVHVLTNVLKSFLREMPEPLLTFDRYDDFLRASDLDDTQDRVNTLMALIKKLVPAHHALLERLVFHLALVAQREQYNRMSASSLAIVFAPCVLRTNRQILGQDSLNDIGRQTKCIETLITQKMLNVKSTLADIDTLDTAAHTATTRLSTLRSSKVFTPEELAPRQSNMETDTEEMEALEGHIQVLKKEKALLTSTLPSLARANSDDDLLSTDLDDGEGGSMDDLSRDCHSIKDSMDSTSSAGQKSIENCEEIFSTVSYNLRDQTTTDYIKNPRVKHFLPSVTSLSSSPSQQQLQQQQSGGGQSKWSSSNSSIGSSGSQQQYSGSSSSKPQIMRSISGGGYMDASSTTTTTLGKKSQQQHQQQTSTDDIVDSISKESKNNNNRKTKRQSSLDDEPIMV